MTLTRKKLMARTSTKPKAPAAAGKLRTSTVQRQPRPRKCAVKTCRERFVPDRPFVTWCSPVCGEAIAQGKLAKQRAAQERQRRAAARSERIATAKKKEALKPRKDWVKEAQQAFNAFIRVRDVDQLCICCDSTTRLDVLTGGSWDAGHFRSVGSAPQLRFNEDNCHKQRKHCNRDGAGRAVDYRIRLIRRIGLARVEALEADQAPRKWTIEELKAIRETYRAKLRNLKKERA